MKLLRFFMPRIEYILLIAIFWGVVASGPRILNFDGDLPRHILTGSLILKTGEVSTTDIFSFRTAGFPSFPHEWLSQVLLATAYKALGLDGTVLLTALVIMGTWWLVFRRTMRISKSFFLTLLFTALGVGASQIHVLPRPHIFTYLLLAMWMTRLEDIHNGSTRDWWSLPILMLVWVNLHGMFVLGMIVLGIYLVGDFLDSPSRDWFKSQKARSLIFAGGLSFLATLLSPSGPEIWEAIASLGSNAYITARIPEYQSANFHLPETWPFVLLLLFAILGFARTQERVSWVRALLMIAFTALALYSSRMIPIFAVAVTPLVAGVVAAWLRNEFPNNRGWTTEENINKINATSGGAIWIIAAVLGVALLLRSSATIDPEGRGNDFDPRFFPVEAVSWLQAHPPQGRMFNEFDWGGYLLLRLWPDQQIFMDGHTHIYGEALTREYERVVTLSPGWQDVLDKYEVGWVIVRSHAPLIDALTLQDHWQISYEDPTTTILIRK